MVKAKDEIKLSWNSIDPTELSPELREAIAAVYQSFEATKAAKAKANALANAEIPAEQGMEIVLGYARGLAWAQQPVTSGVVKSVKVKLSLAEWRAQMSNSGLTH